MSNRYMYHGIDITLETYEKIKTVVEMIAEKENQSFEEAYLAFSASWTYATIEKIESMMWSESAEFIVDEYYRELEKQHKKEG